MTVADFALWMGLYAPDARELWSRVAEKMMDVEVEGWRAQILHSDLAEMERAEVETPVVRLLPNFDTFLLGHKTHGSVVDERNLKRVYRAQGWVSPVVLVNGRAEGVWSYQLKKNHLEVRATSFSRFSDRVESQIGEEASMLGEFLGSPNVRTLMG